LAQEHKHLIIRAEVNNPPKDPKWATKWLMNLVPKIGMKILMGPYSTYCDMPGNAGLTCVVIIETSHISMHVWDETNPAEVQLDIYTCSSLDKSLIFEELQQFDPVKIEYKFLDRKNGLKEIPV
jgi:S-adenosylmethionine/arginine decarboxylase-like enzyme